MQADAWKCHATPLGLPGREAVDEDGRRSVLCVVWGKAPAESGVGSSHCHVLGPACQAEWSGLGEADMQSAESFPGLLPWHPCMLLHQADPAVLSGANTTASLSRF